MFTTIASQPPCLSHRLSSPTLWSKSATSAQFSVLNHNIIFTLITLAWANCLSSCGCCTQHRYSTPTPSRGLSDRLDPSPPPPPCIYTFPPSPVILTLLYRHSHSHFLKAAHTYSPRLLLTTNFSTHSHSHFSTAAHT
jgi:hypothetical protein